MNTLIKSSWANAVKKPEFICVETYSGYGSTQYDPKGVQHLASIDVDDFRLGEMVLDALAHSRFVLPKPRTDVWIHPEATFDSDFYDPETRKKIYSDWISNLMTQFSYKNKQALFKNMDRCDITCQKGTIIIGPTNHDRMDGWSGDGLTEADNVVIPDNSSPAEIGAALRLAFSRCKG